MAYKTILVYLNGARSAEAVLGAALRLAGRYEAISSVSTCCPR
jgi:hypothetical protein